jgi:glycosyltransferase involved in cell wall biosynthesis
MRVAIDMLLAEQKPGGMLLATRSVLNGLAQIDQKNEYYIISKRPEEYEALASHPRIHLYPIQARSWRAMLIRHQLLMPGILRKICPDILHTPAFASPLGWRGPLVLTVHDLAFLKVKNQSSLQAQLYWRYMLRESVRRAQRIIVVSEQTREELISYWSVNPERIRVIHNTLRPSLGYTNIALEKILAMRQRYGEQYLLHVGRIMPRKNVETLVQAFDLLASQFHDLHLVLTGGTGFGSEEVVRRIAISPYRERIHLAGWVTEENLGPLYAAASMLVFPSKHEGFGLPIVEAMACGTPVVASPEAASVNICGDAVMRANCASAQPLTDAIRQVLTDQELRERLIQAGHIQAKPFTNIQVSAAATLQTYQEVLDRDEPAPIYALP